VLDVCFDSEVRRIVRDDFICLWTPNATIAELSLMNVYKEALETDYNISVSSPLFFFNRIKAKIEGHGEGTLLMQELVKILDQSGITVVNHVNPYGGMELEPLIRFYEKYGFELIDTQLMIRFPNAKRVSSTC